MFNVDIYNNPEPLSIFLAQPSGKIICCLDEFINTDDTSLVIGLNQQYELDFTITNSLNDIQTSYEAIQEGMYLFVEKIGLFKMKQPSVKNNGITETKTVIAFSCDCELEDKNCSLSLNMGTTESQEYLVTYDDDETESLLNPYTNIPYDWLVIYNTFPEQLEIAKEKYINGYYGSKDASGQVTTTDESIISELSQLFNLIPRLKNKVTETVDSNGISDYSLTEYVLFTYDESGEKLISITLLSNFLDRVDTLITFYKKYRKQLSLLSVVLDKIGGAWDIGEIYGVSEGDYTLANKKYQFETDETIYSFLTYTLSEASECIVSFDLVNRKVNMTPVSVIGENTGINFSYDNLINTLDISSNDEQLTTRLYVTGASDLSIEQVNFGLAYIDDITYKLNARDSNGKRIYVSDELAEKYMKFIEYRESLRQQYIQYSKDYSSYGEQITELQYRVPNDSLKTDWGTYTYDELTAALTTYKNLLASLIALYKEDYGTAGVNDDGSVNESYIKQTMYWYDYEAYQNTITEIECACHTYPYYSDETKWTDEDIAQFKEAIKAWETDWTLYGTIELQAKIDTYTSNMKILAEQSVILTSAEADTIKTWSELTDDEKEQFGGAEINYFYDKYMTYYNYRQSAYEYLDSLQTEINSLKKAQTDCQANRVNIVKNVTVDNYFTADECKEIYLLYRDSSYSNENILVTSIDDSSKSIDIMSELLDDGIEKLSTLCRPQLTFAVDSDNLLGLVEFQPLWKHFIPGNYILVQYKDNTYMKLRLVGYKFNPLLPSSKEFTMTFSNYIRSKTKVSDLEDLLGLSASAGTNGGSGSSSGGSDGTYGESDDIDVTISNTMLAKLLNSEMFGTRVSNIILDTVDVNSITAKYAKFEGLAKGTTTIDGKCVTTGYIIDQMYNGKDGDVDNTSGSVINLESGKFNFAGGKIKYDGDTLAVKGSITADSGYIGGESGFVIAAGKLYSNGHSAYNTDKDGVYVGTDYIALGKNGATYFKSDGTGKIGSWYVNGSSIYRGNANYGTSGGMYFGTNGISISDKFKVDNEGNLSITDLFTVTKDGKLTATSASITGDITADKLTATSEGTIACWNINSTSIWHGNKSWGQAGGMYFGTSGLSVSNKFTVTATGNVNIGDKLKFDGSTLTFGSDVTLEWSQVSNSPTIPTDVSQLTDSYGQKWSTSIGNSWISTANVIAQNLTVNNGNFTKTFKVNSYMNNPTWGQTDLYFVIDSSSSGIEFGYTSGGNLAAGIVIDDTSIQITTPNNAKFGYDNLYINGVSFGEIIPSYDLSLYAKKASNNTFSGNNTFNGTSTFGDKVTLNDEISANGIKKHTSTSTANIRMQDGTNAWLAELTSSSQRYKHDISDIVDETLKPSKLYDLPIRQYIYNFDYLDDDDKRYNKLVCGFIAEEMDEYYPIATEYNPNGQPENWNERYVIPPMLALIQEQHKEINELKSQLNEILDSLGKANN
jgi:hypothetical protein